MIIPKIYKTFESNIMKLISFANNPIIWLLILLLFFLLSVTVFKLTSHPSLGHNPQI